MFVVFETATGRVRWTTRGQPDLSFDEALGVLPVDMDLARDPGTYIVQNGALADRAATLNENKIAKFTAAANQFASRMGTGFTYSGVLFQVDADSQAQIAAMGALALGSITDSANSSWIDGFYWVAADNSHIPMDAPTTYAFARAVALYVSACILRLRAIKDAIAGAVDQAALDAIDVAVGYPDATA